MKIKYFYEPQHYKFLLQLHGEVTFAYDLHLGHLRDRWKGPAEEYIDEVEER